MNLKFKPLLLFLACSLSQATQSAVAEPAQTFPLPVPAQDEGLPYTRSAHPQAREALGQSIALYPGSRYGYAFGYKTRLDLTRPLAGEALLREGVLYVPASFAPVLAAETVTADASPVYLADRYVHRLSAAPWESPDSLRRLQYEGQNYVAAVDVAKAAGKPVAEGKGGLLIIGKTDPAFLKDPVFTDALITLFDTPDTLADPSIATEYIPLLKRQGVWTDWVDATPEELKLLEGPQTEWRETPKSAYDFAGFNQKVLGSKVPAPGVYPRLLFSPEDLPALRERVSRDPAMAYSYAELKGLLERTWLDPESDDGRLFARLTSGESIGLEEFGADLPDADVPVPMASLEGLKTGIRYSHIAYIGHCLVGLQWLALLEDDAELGRTAAAAAVAWCEVLEQAVDKLYSMSDSEYGVDPSWANGGETAFRMMASADHMDLPFLLDFGGKWMTPEQKKSVARLIAKATYGRADSHAAGSPRWMDNNHTTWHTTIFLAQMAIEGLEGHDPENFPRAIRTLRAFAEYGIDPDGVVFESNGKSGAGFRNALLNMVALARRGENLFGHPHWRKLATAQFLSTSPAGTVTVTSGTYSGTLFDAQGLMMLKTFYPEDRALDWLMSKAHRGLDFSEEAREAHVATLREGKAGNPRLPVFTAPLSPRGTLYDSAFLPVTREEVNLPLTFDAEEHGQFAAFSDRSEDAAWIHLLVRANGYLGAGHHHADSGMFHFSALGVDWIRESRHIGIYDGNLHNLVQVDGRSTSNGPAASGRYLGAGEQGNWVWADADLTPAYTWQWVQQVILWDEASWWFDTPLSERQLSLETDPQVIAAFKGTQHLKMRNWWPSYNFSNWTPTLRMAYNPMEHVQRRVALRRGDHAYGLVIDHLKKDDELHDYTWSACLAPDVWEVKVPGLDVEGTYTILGKSPASPDTVRTAQEGEPLLLVWVLNPLTPPEGKPALEVTTSEGPNGRNGQPVQYERLAAWHRGTESEFKVLLIPFRAGEALPDISYDGKTDRAVIRWENQTDTLAFDKNGRGFSPVMTK